MKEKFWGDIPNPEQLDIDVDRESLFEHGTLLPTQLVFARVHLVRERYLLVIAFWQKANLDGVYSVSRCGATKAYLVDP